MKNKILGKNVRFLLMTVFVSAAFALSAVSASATTYYVSMQGNNNNSGTTLSAPFQTIKKCLDTVAAGDTCLIRTGTYMESMVLGRSGESGSPITIKNYNGEVVTVNSQNEKVIRTNGEKHYYTFEGLNLTSNHIYFVRPTATDEGKDFNVDFSDGTWYGNTAPDRGNSGFIVKDCKIDGSIYFYGHNNQVINTTLNGITPNVDYTGVETDGRKWLHGIIEAWQSSHDNTFRINKIHDYQKRGIWSMSYTKGTLIEGNEITNTGLIAIDIDGAGHPDHDAVVRGNNLYNCTRGIEMENAFDSIVENNIVHDVDRGIDYVNYGNGSPDYTSDGNEYRDGTWITNGVVRNNLVYNTHTSGILLRGAPWVKVLNNTVYNNGLGGETYYGGIALVQYGGYGSNNVDIRNNILAENKPSVIVLEDGEKSGPLKNLTFSNNVYYNSTGVNQVHAKIATKAATNYTLSENNYTYDSYKTKTGTDLKVNALFVNPNFVSPSQGKFNLQAGSPIIDKGIVLADFNKDILGTSRPVGASWEVGAYEYGTNPTVTCTSFTYSTWSACSNSQQSRTVLSSAPVGCVGGNPILTQTCSEAVKYDVSDFINAAANWLKTILNSPLDLSKDGKINSQDLGIMMSNWQ